MPRRGFPEPQITSRHARSLRGSTVYLRTSATRKAYSDEPFWSYSVSDLMDTGKNIDFSSCTDEVVSRAIASNTAPSAILPRLELMRSDETSTFK